MRRHLYKKVTGQLGPKTTRGLTNWTVTQDNSDLMRGDDQNVLNSKFRDKLTYEYGFNICR